MGYLRNQVGTTRHPLELFITAVQGWEAGMRNFENGKSR